MKWNYVTVSLCIDKYLDTRRPIATAADRVAIEHFEKSQSQDGGLPELLLAYSCQPITAKQPRCDWLRRSRSSEITNDVSSAAT